MKDVKAWIQAARLRTLALSFACIILGGALAWIDQQWDGQVFGFTLLTTLLLQVLSNFANDYGDFASGVDLNNRIGPERAMQSGQITKKSMQKALVITGFLSLISGLYLLTISHIPPMAYYVLLAVGVLAIVAAITYTMGKNPYGYRGLGDVFVFIFFGLVAVLGSHYLIVGEFYWRNIWPAITAGSLSVGVLNLNNMRDLESDQQSGKNTLPVYLGLNRAKKYHTLLIVLAWVSLFVYSFLQWIHFTQFLFILLLPLFIIHLKMVFQRSGKSLDPLLKQLSLATLGLFLLFSIGWVLTLI